MLVDSHAHLDSPRLAERLEEVLQRARRAGVTRILTIACVREDLQAIDASLSLADRTGQILVALGVHPHDASSYTKEIGREISMSLSHPRVVGWGEIGLDDYYRNSPLKEQVGCFRSQLELALEAPRPVIIHSREAAAPTCSILEEYAARGLKGVMHCFSYDQDTADRCLDFGFYLSFGGILTFPRSETLQEVARRIPADRYLLETDSPYLAPVPFRGKTNEPAYVVRVAEKMAELRGVDVETVARESSDNFDRLFGLG